MIERKVGIMKSEEIAKLAGVSRSTVSRVTNNYPNVPAATREKVMKIINEHNYVPNTFARTLAGKKSNTIGLFFVITGETHEDHKIARNDYFSSYLNYLVDVANGMDYYVLVNTVRVSNDYEKVNQAFLEKRIDGGVVIGTQSDTLSKIHVENFNAPVVVVDYDLTQADSENVNQQLYVVNSLDRVGIDKAVKYLIDQGHKSIGFIKGNASTRSARVRYEGYQEAMKKYKLTIDEAYIIEGEFSASIAHKNIEKAIENKTIATAYISSNDYMAIEVSKALQDKGYRVPEDVAMIGFDNVSMSEQSSPTLTTLAPKYQDMARKAIEILDQTLTSDKTLERVTEYDVDLMIRESC